MKRLIILLFLLFLLIPLVGQGQSIVGTSGLFHVPTAVLPADGTFMMGSGHVPKAYMPGNFHWATDGKANYDARLYHMSLVFLPKVEVMFRYTGNLGMPKEQSDWTFMDRMLAVRIQLLEEGDRHPALLIGAHDALGGIVDETRFTHFAAQYLVASKHLNISSLRLGLHAGYAANILDLPSRAYDGPFGGLNLMPLGDERLELILEHDSYRPNAAARVRVLRHFSLMAGLWNFEELSLSGSVRVRL
jgi:hypothetical protein